MQLALVHMDFVDMDGVKKSTHSNFKNPFVFLLFKTWLKERGRGIYEIKERGEMGESRRWYEFIYP